MQAVEDVKHFATTTNAPMIHQSILAVMREIGAIGKDNKNEQQKFLYRSIEDVYNRAQPLFATHGVYSVPEVIATDYHTGKSRAGGDLFFSRLTVKYTFFAEDGSSIAATVVGEGMDSGDKASNKAMAAAHKYAICQVLQIPYDVVDPDAHMPEWSSRLDNRVTKAQWNELKSYWWQACKNEPSDDNPKDRFAKWVAFCVDKASPGRTVDAFDHIGWHPDDLAACYRVLEDGHKAAGELFEKGQPNAQES